MAFRGNIIARILTGSIPAASTFLMLCLSTPSFGSDLDADKIRGGKSQKPVTVLQNRYFLKSWRPEVGLIFGSMLNEAYTDTSAFGIRFGMFTSEWIGFEYQFLKTSVKDTADRTALNSLKYRPIETSTSGSEVIVSPDPEVNPIRSLNDLTVLAAPFYGKLNLLDRFIVYSDLYLSAGISRVQTDQKAHTSLSIGAGQRFYFSNNLSVRIDFKDRIYKEIRVDEESTKHAYSFDVGASYFFL